MQYIPYKELEHTFKSILFKNGFTDERATACAHIFATNSLEGVYSHGVNRFPYFIKMVKQGYVKPNNTPTFIAANGAMEQWDGQEGPGPLNARFITERVMQLASEHSMGCIGLANTNHWMRAGYYGWQAAKAGYIFMGWTNTIPNMPAWGGLERKLGNNPLLIAVPYQDRAIVLDMAMSQFSYGKMGVHKSSNKPLPYPGGFDEQGNLTTDAKAILKTWRALPTGYWKGAGLALLLDILATVLSGGLAVWEIGKSDVEARVSQVFLAFDISKLSHYATIGQRIHDIIIDYKKSTPVDENTEIVYPGERVARIRTQNLSKGIPVEDKVWERLQNLLREN